MTTKILRCSCKHHGQDVLHGPQQRVHNWAVKAEQWRCTICGTLRSGEEPKAQTAGEPKKSRSKKKGSKGKAAK